MSVSQPCPLRIGLVGGGRITQTQHIPAIAATPGLVLVAMADPNGAAVPAGVRLHAALDELLPEVDAVAICTPPQIRGGLARAALAAGRHVLLEKPPAATPGEMASLAAGSAASGCTLFTAWHARFSAGADPAREILARRGAAAMRIVWNEDFRKHHPGADWFWRPGGLGVFDAGINAFSIMLHAMPGPIFVRAARFMMPAGAHAPIAARLRFATPAHAEGFTSEHDWNTRDETWTIEWDLADGGRLRLARGGATLTLDGETIIAGPDQEYSRLYARFRDLIRAGRSEIDWAPLQIVADAFLLARHQAVAAVAPAAVPMVPRPPSCHGGGDEPRRGQHRCLTIARRFC